MNIREFLRRLHHEEHVDVARLAWIRFCGQFSDGMFQTALGGAILFNPERNSDPLAIAAGFVVLLVPYSVIGPCAGALLDRWDRRLTLVGASLARIIVIIASGLMLATGLSSGLLLVGALLAAATSRFSAAGVSAALPDVAPRSWLVVTNSVFATAAAICGGLGGSIGVAIIALTGGNDIGSAIAMWCGSGTTVLAAILATRFAPEILGPHHDRSDDDTRVPLLRALASGAVAAIRQAWNHAEAGRSLVALTAHRIVFGVDTLLMVLVMRGSEPASATPGLTGLGSVIGAVVVGMLAAAVVTPPTIARLGRRRTFLIALAISFAAQVLIVPVLDAVALVVAGLVLGCTGQVIKLAADTTLQLEVPDDVRGRVFALQDALFNIGFALAIWLAAEVVPANGHSPGLAAASAVAYLAAFAVLFRAKPH